MGTFNMKLLILFVASVAAAPQGYNLSPPSGGGLQHGSCAPGQIRHVDGRCVTPRVNRRVFLYDVPANIAPSGPPPPIPDPTIETNIIFIRTPEGLQGPEPIVVPPPQQQHVVYVLNKQSQQDQKVINVAAPPATNPEVYFVNYADGENPTLPSGVDLQTALQAASQGGGQTIGGIVGGGGGGGFGSGGGFTVSGGSSGGFGGGAVVAQPSGLYSTPS